MPETNFFWDPLSDNILQELDETGAVTAEYTTEPGLYGNLVSQNRGGQESQYHFDALGSTLALTVDDQQITHTYAYAAFGKEAEHTGSATNPFQYCGQNGYYNDEVAGEYWVRRRALIPSAARWKSVDPVILLEQYCYVANHPTTFNDPSGLHQYCYISVRCRYADDSFLNWSKHCGLELRSGENRFHMGPPTSIDVPGGPPSEFKYNFPFMNKGWDPVYVGMFESCSCIHNAVTKWNSMRLPYDWYSLNSNWALKCLAKKCGIDIPIEGRGWGFTSSYIEECTRFATINTLQCTSQVCVKWYIEECPAQFMAPP
jgi:RHS repeat-associated protein